MAEDYIWTESMTVGYGKAPLMRQVGIHVRAGEVVTLTGPDGVGKSTILRDVIRRPGLLERTVYLDSIPMKGVREREIAKRTPILMTERIHPELMNCEDVVGTGRYLCTRKMGILTAKDRGRVREVMGSVHTRDLAPRNLSQISDRRKQHTLLARAICRDLSVIVLDEPTSFLDIRHKLELLTILKDLVRRKKVAVLMSLHELDLAQKLSDHTVCVKGEYIEQYGTSEEISISSCTTGLCGITKGNYYAESSCLEIEPVKGKPQVFIVGENGSGILVYRRLQCMGILFAAGILHGNDVDYLIARALASRVILETPFGPIREETCGHAVEALASCGQVICCLRKFGVLSDKNGELAESGRDKQEANLLV